MGRWTGSWLSGPAAAGVGARSEPPDAEPDWPGRRLGLPAVGPGSIAAYGRRAAAFLVDTLVANLLAGIPYLFGYEYGPGERGYVVLACFVIENLLLLSIAGQTVGYRVVGVRLASVRGGSVLPLAVVVRTALLVLLVPALITDRDRRGMHDRAAGSMVVVGGPPATPAPGDGQQSAKTSQARPELSGKS